MMDNPRYEQVGENCTINKEFEDDILDRGISDSFPQISLILWRMRFLLASTALASFASASRGVVWFPYLRTFIRCDSEHDSEYSNNSNYWSGSSHCFDKDLVARKAQELLSLATGLNLLIQFFSISFLGAVADCFGRKSAILLAFIGMFVECSLNLVYGTYSALLAGRIIQGLTGGFYSAASASITDISQVFHTRSICFGIFILVSSSVHFITVLLINLLFIKQHLLDYSLFWGIQTIAGLFGFFITLLFFKESLPSSGRISWKPSMMNPLNNFVLLIKYPLMKRMAVVVFIFVLGASSASIYAAFMIETYNWKQEKAAYVGIISNFISAVSISFNIIAVRRIGNTRILLGSFAWFFLCQILLCFSHRSYWFLVFGISLGSLSAISIPSFSEVTTRLVSSHHQAQVQSAFSCSIIISASIGVLVYGQLFKNLAEKTSFVIFLISTMFVFSATLLFLRVSKDLSKVPSISRESMELDVYEGTQIDVRDGKEVDAYEEDASSS